MNTVVEGLPTAPVEIVCPGVQENEIKTPD